MKYFFLLITSFVFGQQTQKVDFTSMQGFLKPNAIEKNISGKIIYDFTVKSKIDTIKIDAQKMEFSSVLINGKSVQFKNSGKQLQLFEGFKKGKNTLTLDYSATPKQTLYFIGQDDNLQIWTQGQGKYTSYWLPSFDDVNEKVIFNLSIEYRNDFEVISNGKLMNVSINSKGNIKTWKYQMQKPMSSYLVMMAIGKFQKKTANSKSGIPLEGYLKPEDASKFTSTYKYSSEIFDFFEKEIGVKYPWEIYKQVPVNDFLYAGMENTSATIFSQDYVVDEIGFNDRNYINVNAHELAHQWFGDLITAESGKHHWLQEGFASYYALLAEKQLFGEDHFNFELLKIAEELKKASKTDTIPILNAKASSLSFYKKGAWALHVLDENVGHKNFQKAVKNYLKKYKFKNVTTDDFLAEVKKVSKYDVDNFKKRWLGKSGFEVNEALSILNKNNFIKQYLDIQKLEKVPFEEKKSTFEKVLKSNAFHPIKEEIIYQLMDVPFEKKKEVLLLVMQSNDVHVRQAVAETLSQFPLEFKGEYESLLEDNSYYTREIALQTLWSQFPEERFYLLEKSKNWVGLNDKSLRMTWISLVLFTPNYQEENKLNLLNELLDYSTSKYDSNVRQNALEVLLKMNYSHKQVLLSLANATIHHKWQLVKFAKDTIRGLIKKEEFRNKFQEIISELPEREKIVINAILNEK
ncbi:M1 family metallopeptidase [Flavobacterium sp.]|uniref:M1 family metallopeptidase n=1 Tax=Flavobacterium sp. TaxID=239 RepID=UPI002623B5F8|nr:M1 family metallopeptidase [Flavobacterium sp.]